MLTVILFGAGASYGAGAVAPGPPPLGNQLFGELSEAFPQSWGCLQGLLRSKFEADFEDGMEMIHDVRFDLVARLKQTMAEYLLRYRPDASGRPTAYARLLQGIADKGQAANVVLSTLNYDLLIEYAITSAGHTIAYDAVSGAPGSMTLLKPHGSCNFLPCARGIGSSLSLSPEMVFETGITYEFETARVRKFLRDEPGLYPAMCLFMRRKPTHMCPHTIRQIQAHWREAVRAADTLILVGVRPNPEDQHLWDTIRNRTADVICVGSEDDYVAGLRALNADQGMKFVGRRFAGAIDSILARI